MSNNFLGNINICFGFVEDINDPLKLGRCRVRLIGYHTDDINKIPTNHLPWSMVINPSNLDVVKPPRLNSQVLCISLDDFFQDILVIGVLNGIDEDNNVPESSSLTRNEDVDEGIIGDKSGNKYSGDFNEPDADDTYNAEYPYNWALETLGGHAFELDDTDGNKRVHLYHNSGSYFEILNDGDLIIKCVGEHFGIFENDKNESIDGDYNIYATEFNVDAPTNITGNVSVTGSITATGDITAFSDKRFKSNIKSVENALEKILLLEGVTYNTIFDEEIHSGLIAQNVEKIIPEVVKENENGYKSVAYGNIVPYLIEAIKELKEEIKEIKKNGITK